MRTEKLLNGVLALQWKDKWLITILSTVHDSSIVTKTHDRHLRSRENVDKPLMVDKYIAFMGGVDKGDQLLSYYGLNHRTMKWYK